MISLLISDEELNSKFLQDFIKKVRELFYILFITNIDVKKILYSLMSNLIKKVNNIELKFKVVEIVSMFELRVSQGTRFIVHIEAMMIQILTLLNQNKSSINKNKKIEYII